jgi:hypothetical protein
VFPQAENHLLTDMNPIAVFGASTTNGRTPGWGFILMTWLYNISFSYACGPLSWFVAFSPPFPLARFIN